MSVTAEDILSVTQSVTKEWTKQRKAEERGRRSRGDRVYVYSDRVNFTDVVDKILPPAYAFASGGGKYSVSKRQLFYACREKFKEATGQQLKYKYFAQTLLVQYLNRHPDKTAAWKVTADARGTLVIPNAGHEVRVPVGTLQIEAHLGEAFKPCDPFAGLADAGPAIPWPSLAPGKRYRGVLYIEKEGFEPLLKDAQIAERFDVAILSCKGQSVVAARRFVDDVCAAGGGARLGVMHDFDKAGFEIAQRLTCVSGWAEDNDRVAYQFRNDIDVTDLGLRLADVRKYGLEARAESCRFKGYFADDSLATEEEKRFLRSHRCVELNAFSSPEFLAWLEEKLTGWLGKERHIPDDETLEQAFRRARAVARINRAVEEVVKGAVEGAEAEAVPEDLRKQLRSALKRSPQAWDQALYELACDELEDDTDAPLDEDE
jgi:hypothetical protein